MVLVQIIVTRVDGHRYSTIAVRDGVQLRVPGYAFMWALPHDLAHFVVEDTLSLDRGFWGSIASGAEFRGMESIAGQRKPHATQTAKRITKKNAECLGEAERLVACFERIVDDRLDGVAYRAEAELKEALAPVRHQSKAITPSEITKVCAAWRAMQSRWSELPVGEAIDVQWTVRSAVRKNRRSMRA